jgi:Homing endonuclease associated repeat
MTAEEVIAAILACKEKLGHVPSRTELMKHSQVKRKDIRKHFVTYASALKSCNLKKNRGKREVEMAELFEEWARAVRELKKIPSVSEYEQLSMHSYRPLVTRFGTWTKVPLGLKQYAEGNGMAEEWKDVMDLVAAYERPHSGRPALVIRQSQAQILTDRLAYGRLIRPCPMLCAPTNEAAVMVLFGAEALRLGFTIVHVQAAYPDCQAWREVGADRLQLVNIEFEHESRNFLRHGHDPTQCDLIVCWIHNWPECPLEVVELSKLVSI